MTALSVAPTAGRSSIKPARTFIENPTLLWVCSIVAILVFWPTLIITTLLVRAPVLSSLMTGSSGFLSVQLWLTVPVYVSKKRAGASREELAPLRRNLWIYGLNLTANLIGNVIQFVFWPGWTTLDIAAYIAMSIGIFVVLTVHRSLRDNKAAQGYLAIAMRVAPLFVQDGSILIHHAMAIGWFSIAMMAVLGLLRLQVVRLSRRAAPQELGLKIVLRAEIYNLAAVGLLAAMSASTFVDLGSLITVMWALVA